MADFFAYGREKGSIAGLLIRRGNSTRNPEGVLYDSRWFQPPERDAGNSMAS